MLEQIILEKQDFDKLLNTTITIHFAENYILNAEVISINEGIPYAESNRIPFSVIFRTEQLNEYFNQGIYPIIHPTKGTIPVFLVPLGPDKLGMRYEAVFN